MALSKNAARTLEQVKCGLSILYGADYFTEDEWIKLDGLIHKGKYVFTSGPQTNILDEELMSFDDFEESVLPTPAPPTQEELVNSTKPDPRVPTPISEKPSLNFSEPTQNEFSGSLPNETSAETSAEASADEGQASVTPTIAEKVSSAPAPAPASIPASTPAPTPVNGGLAWYTQAQLDEVKAFNANLTKAGEKGGAKKARGGAVHSPSVRSFAPSQPNYDSAVERTSRPEASAWDAPEQTTNSQELDWESVAWGPTSKQQHAQVAHNQPSTLSHPAWDAPIERSASQAPAAWDAPQPSTSKQTEDWGAVVEKGFKPERPAWETGSENQQTEVHTSFPTLAPDDVSSANQTFPALRWPQEEQKDENPSPTTAEQASRISSWADEVNAEDIVPVPVLEPVIQEPLNSRFTNGTDNFAQVVEKFIQVHGRQPRSVNDVYQPRNQAFNGPKRPDSRASTRTTTKSLIPSKTRTLFACEGTFFRAHANSPKRSSITIEVVAGDTIKYIKHVSGIMHTGLNTRTKQQGQFPETVLEPIRSQATLIQQQRAAVPNVTGREKGNSFAPTFSHGLDSMEATNAAEWERESTVSRPTTASTQAVAPVPIRASGGLAGSRFTTLAEVESQDGESERAGSMSQAEIRRIIREELANRPVPSQTRSSRTIAPPEHVLTNIVPKTTTCWFWKTKNDCRFTAEECIHLHADLPEGGESTNLRYGKPTWGALADATITPPATTISTRNSLAEANKAIEFKRFSKSKTCYYWATEGKCTNSEEDCRYLHEYTPAGVAPKPGQYVSHKKDFNWSKVGKNGAVTEYPTSPQAQTLRPSEYAWGARKEPVPAVELVNTWDALTESSAALMATPNAAIWGAVEGSSAWDVEDVYKPPHVKALEERERIDAVGW